MPLASGSPHDDRDAYQANQSSQPIIEIGCLLIHLPPPQDGECYEDASVSRIDTPKVRLWLKGGDDAVGDEHYSPDKAPPKGFPLTKIEPD